MKSKAIFWFRKDLRVRDNPGLSYALSLGDVVPLYIFDTINSQQDQMGSASKCWLYHALSDLNHSLSGSVCFQEGDPLFILKKIIKKYDIDVVVWNRCYEPWQVARDKAIKSTLEEGGVQVKTFNASLLWEPWDVSKSDGTPYKVFTPFYRKGCLHASPPREPLPKPRKKNYIKARGCSLKDLALWPNKAWSKKIIKGWHMSEEGAKKSLHHFIAHGLYDYKSGRNIPAKECVSKLSPYLASGQLSPNQIWYKIKQLASSDNTDHFLSELGWREFSYSLLYFNPTLPTENLQSKFDHYPWDDNTTLLTAWQKGLTGYPLVDAGMRELYQTGFMHNRVRMVTASFLVKNLNIHWRHGAAWFWDCLFDADLASNSASWQWVAGCGADAAPFFRVFNPTTQAKKFDPEGAYIRKYLPEISNLPDKHIHSPWEAPEDILYEAGVVLGSDYPCPIIDLKLTREKALEQYQKIRGQ